MTGYPQNKGLHPFPFFPTIFSLLLTALVCNSSFSLADNKLSENQRGHKEENQPQNICWLSLAICKCCCLLLPPPNAPLARCYLLSLLLHCPLIAFLSNLLC